MERPPTKAMMFLLNIANNPIKLVGAWFVMWRTWWLNWFTHCNNKRKKRVFSFHFFAHHSNKTRKIGKFFNIFSHVVPTQKKTNSSLLCSFLHYNNKKKFVSSLFLCESHKQIFIFIFFIPLHIITTKKITKLSFLFALEKKQLKNFFVVGLPMIMAKSAHCYWNRELWRARLAKTFLIRRLWWGTHQ